MQALVLDEFKDLIDTYDDVEWDYNHDPPPGWNVGHPYGCVVRKGHTETQGELCFSNNNHPRIRFMPVVRPDEVTGNGSDVHAPVAGLACVFVDKVAGHMTEEHGMPPPPGQWNVYVRLTDTCVGVPGGKGPLLKALQLVE